MWQLKFNIDTRSHGQIEWNGKEWPIDEKIRQNIVLGVKFYPVGISENFHDQNLWPKFILNWNYLKHQNSAKIEMLSDIQT